MTYSIPTEQVEPQAIAQVNPDNLSQVEKGILNSIPPTITEENFTKGVLWYVNITILILLGVLLTFPGWYGISNSGPYETSGIMIFAFGWAGILVGIISWYWFIGYIFLLRAMVSGNILRWSILKTLSLITFFLVCLISMLLFIVEGRKEMTDIDCSCSFITSYGTSYFAYIVLLVYLIGLTIFSTVQMNINTKSGLIKALSVIASLSAVLTIIVSMAH